MAAPGRQPHYTVEEYLDYDSNSPIKHEYVDGQIVAMSGDSPAHAIISIAIGRILDTQLLERPCTVYSSDMRIEVVAGEMYSYPDISVVCGKPEYVATSPPSLRNPVVIVEVLSPSTERYDRGTKFDYYMELESLQEYLLVSQDEMRVEHYVRQSRGWLLTVARDSADTERLPSIDCDLPLAEIYRKVDFGGSSR